MRIVSFGDIHMSLRSIDQLAPQLELADLVIVSGDLTNFGGREDAEQVIAAVERHARQVLAVCGNLDQRAVMDFLREHGISLHGESRRIGDLGIFGCGGSNFTPFHTPTEFSEEDLAALLERGYSQVSEAPHVLMVCHTPPMNTATDRIFNGQHVGSPTVRAFIEEHQPEVCITGHIHESVGIDRIGRTTVVNAGLLREGGYITVSLGSNGLRAELKRL
jgi:Icc-related predicted phosphoesterase